MRTEIETPASRDSLEQSELARSLSLLTATLESTTDGIVAFDLAGHCVSYNTKFANIWDFPEELLKRRDQREMSAYAQTQVLDVQPFLQRVAEVQSQPDKMAFDVIELKNGRVFERHAIPQKVDGKCVGVVVNWRDITERRLAEENSRESQALYRSLVEQLPTGVFRKNRDGRYAFVNARFTEIVGLPAGEIIGKMPRDLKPRTLAPEAARSDFQFGTQGMAHHELIMSTGRQIEVEDIYVGADGKLHYYHTVKTAVFDPDGRIIGTQGVLFDVTERKLAEAELARERDLLTTLLDHSADMIYFKDQQSRFLRCGKALAVRLGAKSAEEMIGKSDFDFFAEAHARPAFEDEQKIIRTGQPILNKVEKEVWEDGRESWVMTSKTPLRNKADEIIGTFGISKDVTELKMAEARIEEVHKQLLETSRQAGMAEVATGVLHNVGNVLNSVNVSSTLLFDRLKKSKVPYVGRIAALFNEHAANLGGFLNDDPKGKRVPSYLSELADHLAAEQAEALKELSGLHKNIEHIKDIVTMQQTYAKVSGVTQTVRVHELIEDALRMNESALLRHGVQLRRDYTDDLPEITVDKHKVMQILINLIRNAKYACDDANTPEDKQITLRAVNSDGRIKISVIDTGVGIPRENLTRIFSHGFTTRKDGHGFGLHSGAIAAKEMGGELIVESEGHGKGASFTLDLPVQPQSSPA
jgi:PAS domain S-box-containing protein